MAWMLTHGEIPTGMLVCHHCDNPPCCNPAHLFIGTALDNAHDKIAKGRGHGRMTAYSLVVCGASDGRSCGYCGSPLIRKKFSTGQVESLVCYNKRQHCNQSCAQRHRWAA